MAAPISFFTWVFALPGRPADSLGANMGRQKVGVLVVVALGIEVITIVGGDFGTGETIQRRTGAGLRRKFAARNNDAASVITMCCVVFRCVLPVIHSRHRPRPT